MKKNLLKIMSLVMSVIMFGSAFCIGASADTADYQDIEGIDTMICCDEENDTVMIGFYTFPSFTSVFDYDGTYLECRKLFSKSIIPCEITSFYGDSCYSECDKNLINPYYSYTFVIGECTLENTDLNTVNSEYVHSVEYAGYELLGTEKPFMYDIMHFIINAFNIFG